MTTLRSNAPTLIGIGLLAGLAGTIAMTLGQKAEMAATGREPSDVPAKAAERATGVAVHDPAAEERLTTAVHFGYGTALGAALAGLDALPPAARFPLFLAGSWALGQAIEVGLGLTDPPTEQEPGAIATDIGHHIVYAGVAAGAFHLLKRVAGEKGWLRG